MVEQNGKAKTHISPVGKNPHAVCTENEHFFSCPELTISGAEYVQ